MLVGVDDILVEKEPLVSPETLAHYGVGHLQGGNSGRYPWGSGDSPLQRIGAFSDRVKVLRKQGMSLDEIAEYIIELLHCRQRSGFGVPYLPLIPFALVFLLLN